MPRDQGGAQVSRPNHFPWTQQLLLFAVIFVVLMFLHAPLLRLPYFWDEAGYYVPAARDLYLSGSLIPRSTPSNAHPPLVMAMLAGAWHLAQFSLLVTRTVMLGFAAFALVGLFRLARFSSNMTVAWAATILTALYPVFFAQSTLAHVDLPAAAFTFWGVLAYLEDRPRAQVVWFSLAALTKETAILAPLAIAVRELLARILASRRRELVPPGGRHSGLLAAILPALPLACWYAYHYVKTGFVLGNPEFLRYNLTATLSPLRILLAFGLRLWQVFGYLGFWLLTLAAMLALRRPALVDSGEPRKRIPIWMQMIFLAVLVAYLAFMSAVGGAVLARYMLPVTPLIILVLVSTLWRRLRYWRMVVGAVGVVFVAGLFTNPPYGFSPEDNLAYREYVVLHREASVVLAMQYPQARVLTAWPASDELTRPWLGYVARPFSVVRVEDFRAEQVALAAAAQARFDVVLAFSTKCEPGHSVLEGWRAWQGLKERYFGYHRDLAPEQIAEELGGRIVFQKKSQGQWVAVIAMEREKNAQEFPGQ